MINRIQPQLFVASAAVRISDSDAVKLTDKQTHRLTDRRTADCDTG